MLERISTTGPEPVSRDEAKLAARLDGSELDALVDGTISAARRRAEQITGRAYIASVWRDSRQDWPAAEDAIHVHGATACTISYWNGSAWVALAPGAFVFAADTDSSGTVVAPAIGTSWPTLGTAAAGARVRIELTNGDPAVRPVPAEVKDFIRATVAAWVNSPEALVSQQLTTHPLLDGLLDAERLWA